MSDNHDNIDLLKTDDPEIWAKEFVRIKNEKGWKLEDIDFGLMLGWFARAMVVKELMSKKKTNTCPPLAEYSPWMKRWAEKNNYDLEG